jgi:hypothetical protein
MSKVEQRMKVTELSQVLAFNLISGEAERLYYSAVYKKALAVTVARESHERQ